MLCDMERGTVWSVTRPRDSGGGVMRDVISGGMSVECGGVPMCECYVKHGSRMWNQLGEITVRCGGMMQLCKMRCN